MNRNRFHHILRILHENYCRWAFQFSVTLHKPEIICPISVKVTHFARNAFFKFFIGETYLLKKPGLTKMSGASERVLARLGKELNGGGRESRNRVEYQERHQDNVHTKSIK